MKKVVIFDLDGLLIDSEVVSFQIYNDLLSTYGHSFTIKEYSQNYSGKTGLENMETLIRIYKLPISIKDGEDFYAARENEYIKKGICLKSGARNLLDFLYNNQFKIILASSSTKERAITILEQNKISGYFDEMVFAGEVANGKPSPDIFLKACAKSHEPAGKCIVLEDSEAGIQAAFSAGIDVVCIPDMKFPETRFQDMALMTLDSLYDVITLKDTILYN